MGNALPFRKGFISEPFEYLSRLDGRIAAPFCEQDFSFRVAADILYDSLAALGGSCDRVRLAGHQVRLDQYRSLAGKQLGGPDRIQRFCDGTRERLEFNSYTIHGCRLPGFLFLS